MATRAVKNDSDSRQRDVFELEKDDRWQARLDDARARREIALREKAAGKPQKKRLKPWELEGAAGTKPIEPIVQERQGEGVDFADRVATMRKIKDRLEDEAATLQGDHDWSPKVANFEPPSKRSVAEKPAEPVAEMIPVEARHAQMADSFVSSRGRKWDEPSQTKPEIATLASLYAATLDSAGTTDVATEDDFDYTITVADVAVAAPQRRRRPLLLAAAAMLLALVPVAQVMQPLEQGPTISWEGPVSLPPLTSTDVALPTIAAVTRLDIGAPMARPVAPAPPAIGDAVTATTAMPDLPRPAVDEADPAVVWTDVSKVQSDNLMPLFVPSAPATAAGLALDPPSKLVAAPTSIDVGPTIALSLPL